MRHYFPGILLLFLFPFFLFAEEPEVKRERIFTGEGLYGFMNGGAEQFLEYGVTRLVTRDLTYKDEEYTIDIYDMPTPEDAFGIYSLHIFKCTRADTDGCMDCLSPYQLQAVAGNNYISVVFPSGSEAAKSHVDELLRLYIPMDGKKNPRIPDILKLTPPYSGQLKFLRGPISVSGVSTSLSKLLENIPYTGIWFIADKPGKRYKALIYLKDKEVTGKLKAKLSEAAVIQAGNNFIYMKGEEAEKEENDQGDFGF
ncbi:DUF6599 family protein [Parabacteroides sp. AM08-6]|uniref:DUF6599 family protein n=1 Tax=Parabacteroides sp. AM08-6 TaxID=2292053 RepID=UPI000F00925B|nr:DUF6599 family protein [Parabacteroides sp. AM08-6]RHJ82740.1 hypothetical protein DW103_09145 [Parabacteroides sp. AM08-6]